MERLFSSGKMGKFTWFKTYSTIAYYMSGNRKEPISSYWLREAGNAAFGVPQMDLRSGRNDPDSAFLRIAVDYVGYLYRERGLRFHNLPINARTAELAAFFHSLGTTLDWQLALDNIGNKPKPPGSLHVRYSPHPIKLKLTGVNGLKTEEVELTTRRKRMLAFMTGLTQVKMDRFLDPIMTRAELAETTGEYSRDQIHKGILRPLEDVTGVEVIPGSGYRLFADPIDIEKVLVGNSDNHILERKPLERWYGARIRPAFFQQYQLPLLAAIHAQIGASDSVNAPLDTEAVARQIGRPRVSIYPDLKKLVHQGVLNSPKFGGRYLVADVNQQFLGNIIRAQEPVQVVAEEIGIGVDNQTITPQLESPQLSLRVPEIERQEFAPDPGFLRVVESPFDKELSIVSEKTPFQSGGLRPTALFNYFRSLSGRAEIVPWRELVNLNLALDNPQRRDHHEEMLLVGGLITSVYLNEKVFNQARSLWGRSGLRLVSQHVSHMLTQEAKSIDDIEMNKKQRAAVDYLGSLAKANPDLICRCSDCKQ